LIEGSSNHTDHPVNGMKPLSKELTMTSAFIAVGAVVRIGMDNLALVAPTPIYGVLLKIGLTETLAFISGFLYGPVVGFMCGAFIIVISDFFTYPGSWTPFIASIIGLIGIGGWVIRRITGKTQPGYRALVASAIVLTLMSEVLQNAWVAVFYNTPFIPTMITGIPSLITALINNTVFFTLLTPKIIKLVQSKNSARTHANSEIA